ncbi:MAG TPA: hypothetical protein VHZ28_04825 [Terracidiphilus sp.]|jgi:hypothetical protein|nr:hypothetical protein [Terracidiphilus sp.]
MNFYTIRIESFHIDNTRSRHNDTDTVFLAAQAGSTQFGPRSSSAGDVNNGDHGVSNQFSSILLSDADRALGFSFTIYNGDTSSLSDVLNHALTSLLTQGVHLTLPGPKINAINLSGAATGVSVGANTVGITSLLANTSAWYAVAVKAVAEAAINFVFPNCDGYVAADAISLTHQQWNSLIDSAGNNVFRWTARYAGTDSPGGCGSNSNYTVTWSVTRERVQGSMRRFLIVRNRKLRPGLRSLATSAG